MLLKLFQIAPQTDLFPVANRYLEVHSPVWRGRTREEKQRDLWFFLTFLQSRNLKAVLTDFTRENVIAFIGWRRSAGDSPRTIARRFSTLSHFARFLRETRSDFTVSLAGIPLPCPDDTAPRALTSEELYALREQAKKEIGRGDFESLRNGVAIETFLATGLRISELAGLREEQLSEDCAWIRDCAVKGGRSRNVVVLPAARELLKVYRNIRTDILAWHRPDVNPSTTALFCSLRGSTFMNTKSLYSAVVKIGERAGLEIHPHQLRHTVAAQLLEKTNDLRAVAQQLGHRSLQTTMTYTERHDDKLKELLENVLQQNYGGDSSSS